MERTGKALLLCDDDDMGPHGQSSSRRGSHPPLSTLFQSVSLGNSNKNTTLVDSRQRASLPHFSVLLRHLMLMTGWQQHSKKNWIRICTLTLHQMARQSTTACTHACTHSEHSPSDCTSPIVRFQSLPVDQLGDSIECYIYTLRPDLTAFSCPVSCRNESQLNLTPSLFGTSRVD